MRPDSRSICDAQRIDYAQMRDQMGVLVSRVMAEGSLCDPDLAAKALLPAQGDVLEAVTLLRSYRTTLPRFGITGAIDTAGLPSERRVSATFKDMPGGQQLGARSTKRTGCLRTSSKLLTCPPRTCRSTNRCRA